MYIYHFGFGVLRLVTAQTDKGCRQPARPRLLVVDDEDYIRDALSKFLVLRGFEVDQACDGLEAVQKCTEHDYDLVTMDLEMPNLGGREAIERIRRVHRTLPIVVLSGYTQLLDGKPFLDISGLLTKPVSLWKIEAEIRRHIPLHEGEIPPDSAGASTIR
jgi:CheY-like chemotaxis protein